MKYKNVSTLQQKSQACNGKYLKRDHGCTERNKWYILTHLGEYGYCLDVHELLGQLTQLLQIFRSMTQICEIRGDENHNLTLRLHATQFTVLLH